MTMRPSMIPHSIDISIKSLRVSSALCGPLRLVQKRPPIVYRYLTFPPIMVLHIGTHRVYVIKGSSHALGTSLLIHQRGSA